MRIRATRLVTAESLLQEAMRTFKAAYLSQLVDFIGPHFGTGVLIGDHKILTASSLVKGAMLVRIELASGSELILRARAKGAVFETDGLALLEINDKTTAKSENLEADSFSNPVSLSEARLKSGEKVGGELRRYAGG